MNSFRCNVIPNSKTSVLSGFNFSSLLSPSHVRPTDNPATVPMTSLVLIWIV